jgi:hypothetical protein
MMVDDKSQDVNETPVRQPNALFRSLVYWLAILLLSLIVFSLFLFVSNISSFDRGSIGGMVYGFAYRPYVYRTLLPSIIRLLTPLVPEGVVAIALQNPLVAIALSRFSTTVYLRESLLMLGGMYLSLLGFIVALRLLMRAVRFTEWAVSWVPVVCLLLLPSVFPDGKFYDFPTLFLFTLGLVLLVQQRWSAYLPTYTLACINKETAILLALVFAVYCYQRVARRSFAYLLSAQLVVFAVTRLWLMWVFRDNPGQVVEFHLPEHLAATMASPQALLLPVAGLAVLIGYRWREKPVFLRNALIIGVPLGILHLFFGAPYEIRNYLEVLPITLLLVVGGIFQPSTLYVG